MPEKDNTSTAVAEPETQQKPRPGQTKPRKVPPYNVVLLDDDDHTYDYVIEMLRKLFGRSEEEGYRMAKEVDGAGRVIVLTTTKEHAELKRDQIHAYGADFRISRSKGSMSAVIEPVE